MQLTLEIPDDLADALRAAHGDDLARAALERLACEGYRGGRLSTYQVQRLLGLSDRYATQAWLGSRGVRENYAIDDLEADREALARLIPG